LYSTVSTSALLRSLPIAAPLSLTATAFRVTKYCDVIFALGTFVWSHLAKAECSVLR
jgi:hypothetical protein